jgi:hypothetical protein
MTIQTSIGIIVPTYTCEPLESVKNEVVSVMLKRTIQKKISRSKAIAIQRNNGHNVSTLSANLMVSLVRNSIAAVYRDTKKTMLNVSGFNHYVLTDDGYHVLRQFSLS